jgi:hypothetical protein
LNGSVVEFYYLLRTEHYYTLFWKWEENKNKLFLVAHSETASKTLLDVTLTHLSSQVFGH